MFDSNTGQMLTVSIFGLSTLLSSYEIYNIDKRIQEDNLQHLALFSEYGRVAMKGSLSNKTPFQSIDFLVRDWQNFDDEENIEKCLSEMKPYLDKIMGKREVQDLDV